MVEEKPQIVPKKDAIALEWAKKRARDAAIEEARKELARQRRREVEEHMEVSAIRAASTLSEIMDSDDAPPIVRVAAAKDILDRAGYKPIERKQVEVTMPKPILDLAELTGVTDDSSNGQTA